MPTSEILFRKQIRDGTARATMPTGTYGHKAGYGDGNVCADSYDPGNGYGNWSGHGHGHEHYTPLWKLK